MTKILLFVIAALALLWLLRRNTSDRRPPPASPSARPGATSEAQPMLACVQCGLHLPRDEALPGRGGVFCSEAHRRAYELAHPGPQ